MLEIRTGGFVLALSILEIKAKSLIQFEQRYRTFEKMPKVPRVKWLNSG